MKFDRRLTREGKWNRERKRGVIGALMGAQVYNSQGTHQGEGEREAHSDLGFDSFKKAEPSCKISSSVRLCWELEEPKGPNGFAEAALGTQSRVGWPE